MSSLTELLTRYTGGLPGAVALVARGEQVEAAAVGSADAEGTVPMARDALFRVVIAQTRDEPHPPGDLEVVNEAAARPALVPAITPTGERQWAGAPTGTHLAATVARDAVELLTGPFAHRIRTCAAEDCHLVYVDTSRPGRRRWCSMEHCGNRHKVRALRARHTEEG